MTFQKKGYPLLRISCTQHEFGKRKTEKRYAKEDGQIAWVTGLFFLLFLGILLCTCLQVSAYRVSSFYLEDALAASNLASAVIDLEEYGRTHAITVAEPHAAYARFCEAVCGNLQLNEEWECSNKVLLSGKVSVEKYIIYNVKDDMVTVYEVSSSGVYQWQGMLGSVAAPNGTYIESTSIYSELSFPVNSLFGVTVNAHKGQLVDIVSDREGE